MKTGPHLFHSEREGKVIIVGPISKFWGLSQNFGAYALIEKLGLSKNVQYRLRFFPNLESEEMRSLLVTHHLSDPSQVS